MSLTDDQSNYFDDESDENRVTLLVQNVVPPFLDGRFIFTKQSKPVMPVSDPTCDLAIVAVKGSKVRENRICLIDDQVCLCFFCCHNNETDICFEYLNFDTIAEVVFCA